jgi:hypothetical protein
LYRPYRGSAQAHPSVNARVPSGRDVTKKSTWSSHCSLRIAVGFHTLSGKHCCPDTLQTASTHLCHWVINFAAMYSSLLAQRVW